jgi:hypothetical protein
MSTFSGFWLQKSEAKLYAPAFRNTKVSPVFFSSKKTRYLKISKEQGVTPFIIYLFAK